MEYRWELVYIDEERQSIKDSFKCGYDKESRKRAYMEARASLEEISQTYLEIDNSWFTPKTKLVKASEDCYHAVCQGKVEWTLKLRFIEGAKEFEELPF